MASSSSPHSLELTILEQSQISSPPGSSSSSSPPHPSIPLTTFDLPWLFSPPVERLFFYPFPHPTSSFTESHLPTLKSSLSLTLLRYFSLSATLRRTPNTPDRFELHSTPGGGDGIPFTLALAEHSPDDDYDQLSRARSRAFARIRPLIPQLPPPGGPGPLLAVQVTLFPGRGVCLGVATHHVAGDGSTTTRFLKSWALASRSREPPPVGPTYDRGLIPDERPGLYSILYSMCMDKNSKPKPCTQSVQQDDKLIATFTLQQDQIQRLKQTVAAAAGDGAPLHCSSFVVTCAYVWACLVKARESSSTPRSFTSNEMNGSLDHGDDGGITVQEQKTHFLFSVDCRGRLDPPVPESYAGNCLRPCYASVSVKELVGENGVAAAAVALGTAIEGMGEDVMRGPEEWGRRIGEMVGEGMVTVAGSPRFRVYDVDFGWGRPERVEVPSVERSGAIALTERREGGGGVEIGVVLGKDVMDRFETCFDEGLKV